MDRKNFLKEIKRIRAEIKAEYDLKVKIKADESAERLYIKGIINFEQYELLMSKIFLKHK
jgi:hypothetical protein